MSVNFSNSMWYSLVGSSAAVNGERLAAEGSTERNTEGSEKAPHWTQNAVTQSRSHAVPPSHPTLDSEKGSGEEDGIWLVQYCEKVRNVKTYKTDAHRTYSWSQNFSLWESPFGFFSNQFQTGVNKLLIHRDGQYLYLQAFCIIFQLFCFVLICQVIFWSLLLLTKNIVNEYVNYLSFIYTN